MIGFKSTLLNVTLAITAALPFATVGLFTSAGSAQAATLSGEIQFTGGFTASPFASSQITFSKDALTFTPQPITPIGIGSATGNFSAFNSGNIGNIISFSSKVADNPFIDFGSLTYPGFISPGENTSSITDGLNTFTLTSSSYKLNESGLNVGIDVALFGFFTSATGEISNGGGNLTFQVNNKSVASVNSILTGGGSISNLSFSGGTFTTSVPEPAALLGLGAVGGVMAMSRRRKSFVQ